MKNMLTAIPESSTCHSLLAKVLRVRQKRENSISYEREAGRKRVQKREEEMEREERERRLGSSSTSVQLRLLIMGLRSVAGLQLFSWNR